MLCHDVRRIRTAGRSPWTLSQVLTSEETAGAEAPPRADEAVNNDSRPLFLSPLTPFSHPASI